MSRLDVGYQKYQRYQSPCWGDQRDRKTKLFSYLLPVSMGETKYWPFRFATFCFSFVDSESTMGLTLPCASILLFLLLFSTVNLICILRQSSKSLLRMRSLALYGEFYEAHNLAWSYPQQQQVLFYYRYFHLQKRIKTTSKIPFVFLLSNNDTYVHSCMLSSPLWRMEYS